MSVRKSLITATVIGLAVVAPVVLLALPQAWSRQFVGESNLSFEIPGKLKKGEPETVTDANDWVRTSLDYTFDNDDFFVQVTVFTGGPSVKVDGEFLKKVMKDVMEGVKEDDTPVTTMDTNAEELDGAPALRSNFKVGTGKEQFIMRVGLVGEKNMVYAVIAVAFPDSPASMTAAERTLKSLRFTRKLN